MGLIITDIDLICYFMRINDLICLYIDINQTKSAC